MTKKTDNDNQSADKLSVREENNLMGKKARLGKTELSDAHLESLLEEIKDETAKKASLSHHKVKSAIMANITEQAEKTLQTNPQVQEAVKVIAFRKKTDDNTYRIQSLAVMVSLVASLMLGVFIGTSNNLDAYINPTLEIAGINVEEEAPLLEIINLENG